MTLYKLPDDMRPGHCWIDSDHPELGEFWARADMDEADIIAEWDSALSGDPALEAEALARSERDRLLKDSDWTQLPDAPVDQARWAIYRQALRDLDMTNPDWPQKPEGDVSEDEKLRVERVLDRAARTILFDGKNKA